MNRDQSLPYPGRLCVVTNDPLDRYNGEKFTLIRATEVGVHLTRRGETEVRTFPLNEFLEVGWEYVPEVTDPAPASTNLTELHTTLGDGRHFMREAEDRLKDAVEARFDDLAPKIEARIRDAFEALTRATESD